MTELYRATWDERYLEAARDWAKALVEMFPKNEEDWGKLGAVHYCWKAMANYVRLSGDAALMEALEGYARRAAHGPFGYSSLGDAAEGYFVTRDPFFLDCGKARLMELFSRLNVSDAPSHRGTTGSWSAGHHPYATRTIPVLLAAMTEAPPEWRRHNLPLVRTNRSLHLAGPRLPVLHIEPVEGGEAKLSVRIGQKQALILRDPQGTTVRQVEAGPRTHVEEIALRPAAAKKDGIYTISFPLRPTRHKGDYVERGNIDLVAVNNAKLAIAPSTTDGHFCIFAPRLYFMVPKNVKAFDVEVETMTTWAAYAWHPVVSVFAPDGSVVQTESGPGLVKFSVTPKPEQTGRLWAVGPLGRVSAPTPNVTWKKDMRPVDAHFPAWLKLSENLPQFVSTHPELFFDPGREWK